MTKQDLANRVSAQANCSQSDAHAIIQKMFDAIVNSLVVEGRVEFRGFGVFEVRRRAARKGRNPRTGESISVPEKIAVTFTPGTRAKHRLRDLNEFGNSCRDAA